MTYAEKLKDPRWQKMRLKVMEYAKFRCQICGAKERTLHIHHSYYVKGKEPWQYYIGSLICICEVCHGIIHPERNVPPPKTHEAPLPIEEVSRQFAELKKKLSALPSK